MILAGDEMGRTQQGNNNAYCQDNEVSWLDWCMAETHADLLAFLSYADCFPQSAARCCAAPASNFMAKTDFTLPGMALSACVADWGHESRTVAMQLTQLWDDGSRDDLHFIANAYSGDLQFELPQIGKWEWFRLADTALASPLDIAEDRPGISPAVARELHRTGAQRRHLRREID